MQTSETADFFGFRDRGRLRPGLRADVNLIDFDRLRLHQPEIVHDLPAGGRRLVQRVDGYRATLVAGTPIFENGEDTGARPAAWCATGGRPSCHVRGRADGYETGSPRSNRARHLMLGRSAGGKRAASGSHRW